MATQISKRARRHGAATHGGHHPLGARILLGMSLVLMSTSVALLSGLIR